MSLKPKNQGNNESSVDWDKVNSQVPEDTVDARIAYVIDLGTQERTQTVVNKDKSDITYVADEDAALALMEVVTELVGDWVVDKEGHTGEEVEVTQANLEAVQKGVKGISVGDTVYEMNFKVVDRKDAQEVAYIADCVDTYVEYVEGEGGKQYRAMFNQRDFQTGNLNGYALSIVPPQVKGGDWTYAPTSWHKKIADATYTDLVAEDNDVESFVNKPLAIQITKNAKGFAKFKPQAIPKKYIDDVAQLDCKPACITFENVTVEMLEEAKLNKMITDKIKMATNYEGSKMQSAIEEWEATRSKKSKPADEVVEDEQEEDAPSEPEEQEEPKEEAKAPVKKKLTRKKKVVEVPEDDDDFDPFA